MNPQPSEGRSAAGPPRIVGVSEGIAAVRKMIERLGPTPFSILIVGESGTGKELVARGLHTASRRGGAFVAVNCAAIPESLIESELFGHRKGAFTGADRDRKGLFLAADRGTLFLDEVGELPLALQAKLLRVLELGEVRAVGATEVRLVDVRVIAATNRELMKELAERRFRRDLYPRLFMTVM
jgi:transcriptional regulator with PAS, ATPase and Fis domain